MTEQNILPQVHQTKTEQITPWLTESFNIFKSQPGIFILFLILELIITVTVAYIPILGAIASFIFAPLFFAGWLLALEKKAKGSEIEVGDLFLAFKNDYFLPVIFVSLAIILIMVGICAPVVILGILIGVTKMVSQSSPDALFYIAIFIFSVLGAAIYCLYLMISAFAVQLVVLDKVETFSAIKLSAKACIENIWPLTLYGLIILGLSLLCVLTVGLGFLILAPVIRIFNYVIYKGIFTNATPTQI